MLLDGSGVVELDDVNKTTSDVMIVGADEVAVSSTEDDEGGEAGADESMPLAIRVEMK